MFKITFPTGINLEGAVTSKTAPSKFFHKKRKVSIDDRVSPLAIKNNSFKKIRK
ncbi:hypothetical protein LFU01_35490 [Lysinibacillus fusiformis]|nr:hypothetical protein LFU01_35490 [Lysinibacillus fusiformis]